MPIDDTGVARLKRSLTLGKTPIRMFTYLMYGRATDPIPPVYLQDLMLTIAGIPDGYEVAVAIFSMRLHSEKKTKKRLAPELAMTGRELLRQLRFTKNGREDYRLSEIAKRCHIGDEAPAVVQEVCARLKAAVKKYETYAFNHDDLLHGLFDMQPLAAARLKRFAEEMTKS